MNARPKSIIIGIILCVIILVVGIRSFLNFAEEAPIEVSHRDSPALEMQSSEPQRHAEPPKTGSSDDVSPSLTSPESGESEIPLGPSPQFMVISARGEAIPHARVFWRDSGRSSSLSTAKMGDVIQTAPSDLAAYGILTGRCDEKGCLTIPDCRGDIEVWADAPGFSCRWSRNIPALELRSGCVSILLFKDLSLHVRLKSDLGQSLEGIPVGLLKRQKRSGLSSDLISQARSNEAGELSLVGPYEDLPFPGFEYFIALQFPLAKPVELVVNPFEDFETVHELQVPPYGAMRMLVAEKDRYRLKPGQFVSLYPASSCRRPGFEFDVHALSGMYQATGQILFRPIGLGMSLTLQGSEDDDELKWLPFPQGVCPDLPGPREIDEVVEFSCPEGESDFRFSARVLDHDGNPLPNQAVEIESLHGYLSDYLPASRISLDSHSRVEFSIMKGCEGEFARFYLEQGAEPFEISMRLADDPNQSEERPRCQFSLPAQPWLDVVDLGDIKLEQPPLKVSGTVVDSSGQGIPFAYLEWSRVGESCRLPVLNDWIQCCDHEGRFRLGEWPEEDEEENEEAPAPWGLWAWAPGYHLKFLPIPKSPIAGVEIRLEPSLPVELQIEIDETIKPHHLILEFSGSAVERWQEQSGADLKAKELRYTRFLVANRMRLDNLAAGALQVRVLSRDFYGVELLRENYLIPEQLSEEPYQIRLDLRGAIRVTELQALSEEGDVLNGASLRWRHPDDLSNQHVFHEESDYAGRFSLPSDLLRRDCVLVCEGFESKHFDLPPASGRVVLKRVKPIVLQVTAEGENIKGGAFYIYAVHPLLGEFACSASGPRATLTFPEPGLYTLSLYHRDRRGLEFLDVEVQYKGDEPRLRLHFLKEK